MLRVLEGALTVSEYTDKVDIFSYRGSKVARIQQELANVFAVLSGMLVAAKGKRGQDLIQDRALSDNEQLFASIFEVGRRHKVMNPDKMRSTYGKLMFMLQDTQAYEIQSSIGFQCVRTIVTVHTELEQLGAEALLDEEELVDAVAPVQVRAAEQRKPQRHPPFFFLTRFLYVCCAGGRLTRAQGRRDVAPREEIRQR